MLTEPMKKALGRLCNAYVYADQRSVRALIRRGLVANYGSGKDDLIGSFRVDVPTQRGRDLWAELTKLPTPTDQD